jgi:hypothetical protein
MRGFHRRCSRPPDPARRDRVALDELVTSGVERPQVGLHAKDPREPEEQNADPEGGRIPTAREQRRPNRQRRGRGPPPRRGFLRQPGPDGDAGNEH